MGQSYCTSFCGERTDVNESPLALFLNAESDEPMPQVALKVKQHIELHSKIKQTYMLYRTPHPAETKDATSKLDLHYLFQFAAYYEGEWKQGLPHGFGRVIYDDGSIYEGCFHRGVASCSQALFIKYNGSFYRGAIRENKANGYGDLSTAKLFYKGHWQNDLPQGKGREIYSSISFYEGEFKSGKKQGQGIYQWNQNEYYIGRFHNNKLHGKGDLITLGYTYKGDFKEGKKQGKGRYIDNDAKFEYIGDWVDNKPEGDGIIIYQDGTKFNGKFNGFGQRTGMLVLASGERMKIDGDEEDETRFMIEKAESAASQGIIQ